MNFFRISLSVPGNSWSSGHVALSRHVHKQWLHSSQRRWPKTLLPRREGHCVRYDAEIRTAFTELSFDEWIKCPISRGRFIKVSFHQERARASCFSARRRSRTTGLLRAWPRTRLGGPWPGSRCTSSYQCLRNLRRYVLNQSPSGYISANCIYLVC